jgi:NTP pyrophosphatase (non-canonical NTP hydrolase)
MDFSEYQENAKSTAIYPDELRGRFFYPSMGLAGEVGELLNKIKKIARDGAAVDKEDIEGEIGDVLWYLAQLSTEFGIDLGEAASHNLDKLKSRKERGVIGGSGDRR